MAAQSVFDAGDPITSRLKLGVAPDGTTDATVVVKRPDGTPLAGLIVSAWGGTGGDEKVVQWYATDDGAPPPSVATEGVADGDWLAVWTVTGTGASVTPKVYSVRPLPTTTTRPRYMPFLSDVADFVPWLTLDTTIPGGQTFLGTFTGNTVPTDEQVQRHINRVVGPIQDRWPALPSSLYRAVRTYVVVRVAANLARAFPANNADLRDADALSRQADGLWADLRQDADDAVPSGTDPGRTGQVPIYAFPPPVAHGDLYL